MDIFKILEIFKDFNVNDVWQTSIVVITIMIIFSRYMTLFFVTNVELLLMRRKEKEKRNVIALMMIYVILAAYNIILVMDEQFVVVELLAVVILVIFTIGMKIASLIAKGKYKIHIVKGELSLIILVMPIIILAIVNFYTIKHLSAIVIGSAIETLSLFLVCYGFQQEKATVKIISLTGEELYVYTKIEDEYMLCGDNLLMEEAKMIITIPVRQVLDNKYYLSLCREDKEVLFPEKSKRKKRGKITSV